MFHEIDFVLMMGDQCLVYSYSIIMQTQSSGSFVVWKKFAPAPANRLGVSRLGSIYCLSYHCFDEWLLFYGNPITKFTLVSKPALFYFILEESHFLWWWNYALGYKMNALHGFWELFNTAWFGAIFMLLSFVLQSAFEDMDGHRAPVFELLSQTRSIDTQTPSHTTTSESFSEHLPIMLEVSEIGRRSDSQGSEDNSACSSRGGESEERSQSVSPSFIPGEWQGSLQTPTSA